MTGGPLPILNLADSPRAPGRLGWWWLVAAWWPAAYGALLGALLFTVARDAMPDDGLISLSFARNLAEHGQWALTTGIESNTATSPLNVGLLAGLHLATGGHAFVAAALLLGACLAASAIWLHSLGGTSAALLGPALLATSPVLTSSIGLETYLCAAVLIGLVRYGADGRWAAAGVFTGAAVLARPDLTVPALVAVGVLAASRRQLLLALPVGGLVALPWVLFSWLHFGSAWANSVAVKWAVGAWDGGVNSISNPVYFFGMWPFATMTIAATLIGGVVAVTVALRRRQWPAAALGLAGAAHLLTLASTSTPPIEYYLGPSVTGLGMALVLVTARGPQWALAAPEAVVAGCVALSIAHGSLWAEGLAPMRQNMATDAQYAVIARELPTDGVVMGGEVGALAFYCQDRRPACTIVDPVLSDPGRVDGFVSRWRAAHRWLDANYLHYRVPAPTPVKYRIGFGFDSPRPGDWPITRAPGFYQWARLSPAVDPLAPS